MHCGIPQEMPAPRSQCRIDANATPSRWNEISKPQGQVANCDAASTPFSLGYYICVNNLVAYYKIILLSNNSVGKNCYYDIVQINT